MIAVGKQLLAPLKYLAVRGHAKWTIDLLIPGLLAVGSTVLLVWVPAPLTVAGGLVERVNELLQVLVGFYVASLAAVSSISSRALDQKVDGALLANETLTRRRFLSLLFGYLSIFSLALYVLGVLSLVGSGRLSLLAQNIPELRSLVLGLYCFACWHMVCVMMLSVYYLVDRVYTKVAVIDQSALPDSASLPDEDERDD